MRKVLLASLLVLASCSKKESSNAPAGTIPAARLAPASVGESLKPGATVGSGSDTQVKGSSITIQKSALKKLFLLSMNLSNAAIDPTPNVLLPKVVYFEQNGSEVGILEQGAAAVKGLRGVRGRGRRRSRAARGVLGVSRICAGIVRLLHTVSGWH